MSVVPTSLLGVRPSAPAPDAELLALRARPAEQQPTWPDHAALAAVTDELRAAPDLVTGAEIGELRGLLAGVAEGRLRVLQAGDCAEDPEHATTEHVARRAGMLVSLGDVMSERSRRPVVLAGRMGGQFAKPRSQPTEVRDGCELPAFRGHLVNGPAFDARTRVPDPRRMLTGYRAAADVVEALRRARPAGGALNLPRVWTSHEALVLDYELPLLRKHDDDLILTSTHWPWVGERTRRLDGAHVQLLSRIANPVACKVGPAMTASELVALCERLDPRREPGRLTLITRLGASLVSTRLPELVAAVRRAGHPVIWLCDPMHGNTFRGAGGRKSRLVGSLIREVLGFHAAVRGEQGVAGGLHLEATPEDVVECVLDETELAELPAGTEPLCDPRLNADQARLVATAWPG
ncbi:3-deoxy-7-phosphoheptulonate synthase [Amycolatopsis sp. NPDC059027]|uniref:3-deoxy-7-phosphoheptulonate synthase n=1 Tax=Amycolatopsis sp. NPDC059027 TaxID=3346709 RepID=UPI00366E7D19